MTLACGDRVQVATTDGGGVIVAILPRITLFYRSDAFREKLIAANVTQIVGVVAPDIGVDEELINRWIIAAEAERCRLVLVANKADKPGFDTLLARLTPYAALGYPVVPLSAKQDVAPLLPWLRGQRTVLIGQSGMGKSTILNALLPEAAAKTAEISMALLAGRHTTTHSMLYPLPDAVGGWIVDSPGMKAFGPCTPHAGRDYRCVRRIATADRSVPLSRLPGTIANRDARYSMRSNAARSLPHRVAPDAIDDRRQPVGARAGTLAASHRLRDFYTRRTIFC
jgi:ribosome biogenesis GTPase